MILLDSSALVALLQGEQGADVVASALEDDEGAISVVNLSETLERVGFRGPVDSRSVLDELSKALTFVPMSVDDALGAAELYPHTRRPALSLADRVAIATARRLGTPVLTTDGAWDQVEGLDVRVIR